MKYKTHNQATINTNMSSGRGSVHTTYDTLRALFGKPEHVDCDGKVRVEWSIRFDDGTVATIYDWKDPAPIHEVTDWHIGGFTQKAACYVAAEVAHYETKAAA